MTTIHINNQWMNGLSKDFSGLMETLMNAFDFRKISMNIS